MVTTIYKDTLIVSKDGRSYYYLYDADGDVNEHCVPGLQAAKDAIDAFEKKHGGLYDADGNLHTPLHIPA